MEETSWEERQHALTHILTHPTNTPSLHSQFLISSQIPCYLNWDYPPILCPKPIQLKWAISLFLKRVSKLGVINQATWRSNCPYQQPPPLVLAEGAEEAKWGDEDKREWLKKRFRKKKMGNNINPWIPILIPNLIVLSFLFWDPYQTDRSVTN